MQCPSCSQESPQGAKFCVFCGKAFPPPSAEVVQCRACGKSVKAGFKFCPFCGHTIEHGPVARFCASCGVPLDRAAGDKPFCTRCNTIPAGVNPPSGSTPCLLCTQPAGSSGLCAVHDMTHTRCTPCAKTYEKITGMCPSCRAIDGLPRDFTISTDDYEYKADREALKALRSIKAANMAMEQLSRKFGKSFIESRFIGGGIKVNEAQFPRIQHLAILAARILGVRKLPEIYISGDLAWASDTYGSETGSFIVLGTFLSRALSDMELLFILGHELAHVKSGHAMYRTVAQVFAGYSGPRGVMGGGILGLLDLQKLVSSAIELPLLAWIRESEVTGDCAGLLVVQQASIARKVLMLQALRSPELYKEINQEAYLRQQEEVESQIGKLSEFLSQNTPYVSRRIRLLDEFSKSPAYADVLSRMSRSKDFIPLQEKLKHMVQGGGSPTPGLPGGHEKPAGHAPVKAHKHAHDQPAAPDDRLRGKCPHCKAPFSVLINKIPAGVQVELRCKHCAKTFPVESITTPRQLPRQRDMEDYSD